MNNTKQIILILVALAAFAGLEIYLFDYTTVSRLIPWGIFVVVFIAAIYFGGAIQGMFRAKKKDGV